MSNRWSIEQEQFLLDNAYKVKNYKELWEMFNQKFNCNKNFDTLKTYCLRVLKIKRLNEKYKTIHIYTEEEVKWIEQNYLNYKTKSSKEFADEFNKIFNTNITHTQIVGKLKKLGYKRVFNEKKVFKPEICEYINLHLNDMSDSTIAKQLKKIYGININGKCIKGYRARNNIKKGKAIYNIDKEPTNARKIGYERFDKGEWIIKVDNRVRIKKSEKWKLKKVYLYEKYHNCKVDTSKFNIIFLDGDKNNFDMKNLKLISKSCAMYLNVKNMKGMSDITNAMCEVFETEKLIKDLENE